MKAGDRYAARTPSSLQEHRQALSHRGWLFEERGRHQRACLRDTPLVVALVNNMPDGAFRETERQFADLLTAAAAGVPFQLVKYWMPGVPRGAEVRRAIATDYLPLDDIYRGHSDALIVTGTEPSCSRLTDEPFFANLATLIEWAETNTRATLLSCLAAHAAVLLFDGLERTPLPAKATGVFRDSVAGEGSLVQGMGRTAWMPHSRLNDVDASRMRAVGYLPLLESATTWTAMAKMRHNCLFLLYQGHPEYGPTTLLREHRRDVRRYLRGEAATYPARPRGYFDPVGDAILARFEHLVTSHGPREELLGSFPTEALEEHIKPRWTTPAVRLYSNWLSHLQARRQPQTRGLGTAGTALV